MKLFPVFLLLSTITAAASDCDLAMTKMTTVGAKIESSNERPTFRGSVDDIRFTAACYPSFTLLMFESEAHQPTPMFFRQIAQISSSINGAPSAEINDALAACGGIAAMRVPPQRVTVPFSRGDVKCVVEQGDLSQFDVTLRK